MSDRKEILVGMEEICEYTGLSAKIVLDLIRDHIFPARKTREGVGGGVWISNRTRIDEWSRAFVVRG